MPYATIDDLPQAVLDAIPSDGGRRMFMRVVNSALDRGLSDARAFASAWSALERAGYERGEDGSYEKSQPAPTDVHVPSTRRRDLEKILEWIKKTLLGPDDASLNKAEYQGREVDLDKPFRTPGESKKFAVYVRDGDSVKIVRFGDPDMEIKRDDPEARRNFRARHSCDQQTDKTTAAYWSCRMWDDDMTVSEVLDKFELTAEISKIDDEMQVVYGWASIIEENGQPTVDTQGDIITERELIRAAHDFMRDARAGGVMHMENADGEPVVVGEIVESMIFTKDLQAALSIDLGMVGWLIGFHVTNADVWRAVKEGSLRAFSIGGSGTRKEVSV